MLTVCPICNKYNTSICKDCKLKMGIVSMTDYIYQHYPLSIVMYKYRK